jgi:hypothetical protein
LAITEAGATGGSVVAGAVVAGAVVCVADGSEPALDGSVVAGPPVDVEVEGAAVVGCDAPPLSAVLPVGPQPTSTAAVSAADTAATATDIGDLLPIPIPSSPRKLSCPPLDTDSRPRGCGNREEDWEKAVNARSKDRGRPDRGPAKARGTTGKGPRDGL